MTARILALLAMLLLAMLGVSHLAVWRWGHASALNTARSECHTADLDRLQAVIASTQGLTEAAHAASQQLGQTIDARQQADAKTTREIRDALKATASTRAGCVFDAGVMQQLAATRDRAAAAAAGGLRGALPGAD